MTEANVDIKTTHAIQPAEQNSAVSEYGLTMEQLVQSQVTMDSPKSEPSPEGYSRLLSLKYYRQYFKVTESQVILRIKLSLRPFRSEFFEISRENPDLYGPFWILTTIVFLLSSAGNLARYFNNWQKSQFIFKLTLVRYAVIIVYSLGIGFPLVLGLVLGLFQSSISPIQVICLYGYSLSSFILVLLLCIIPSDTFHWLLMLYGILNSSAFLIMNLNQEIQAMNRTKVYLIYGLIACCQITLFLVFKLVFFDIVYER